jgi:hypothetical protein
MDSFLIGTMPSRITSTRKSPKMLKGKGREKWEVSTPTLAKGA